MILRSIGPDAPFLYRSTRQPGGICLVFFPEFQAKSGLIARTHDPSGALPRNDLSWRA